MKLKIDKKEMPISVVILAICVWLYTVAAAYPEASRRYPQTILIAIGALAAIEMVVKTIRKSLEANGENEDTHRSHDVLLRVLTVMAICVAYVALVGLLGFFSATAIFSVALMYYMGVRKPMPFIAVALGLNLGVYLLFVVFLRILVPQGLLF